MAATERVASSAARNAAHRFTPRRGRKKSITATVKTLAAAGSRRTLKGVLSTCCTAHSAAGYRMGEELQQRVP